MFKGKEVVLPCVMCVRRVGVHLSERQASHVGLQMKEGLTAGSTVRDASGRETHRTDIGTSNRKFLMQATDRGTGDIQPAVASEIVGFGTLTGGRGPQAAGPSQHSAVAKSINPQRIATCRPCIAMDDARGDGSDPRGNDTAISAARAATTGSAANAAAAAVNSASYVNVNRSVRSSPMSHRSSTQRHVSLRHLHASKKAACQ